MHKPLRWFSVLLGVAAFPALAVTSAIHLTDPLDHHFGRIPMYATYAAQYFSFTNQGNSTIRLGQANIKGDFATCQELDCPVVAPGDFVLGNSDGCSQRSLAPGASCSILVGFVPKAGGGRIAQLSIPTAEGLEATVILYGTGEVKPADCIFDWAEAAYPGLFPLPADSFYIMHYYARCYGSLCMGVDIQTPQQTSPSAYLYDNGNLQRVGSQQEIAAMAGCL